MFQSFRHAATWVHTWFGLVLGFVLVVVFFFGSLSVFDREIDRWAIPASRFPAQRMPSFDKVLRPVFESLQPNEESLEQARLLVDRPLPAHWDNPSFWRASTTHRDPVLELSSAWETPHAKVRDLVFGNRTIDPRNGKLFPDDQLRVSSQFLYPLHYKLDLDHGAQRRRAARGADVDVVAIVLRPLSWLGGSGSKSSTTRGSSNLSS